LLGTRTRLSLGLVRSGRVSSGSPRTSGADGMPGAAPTDPMDVPARRLSIGAIGQGRRGGSYRLIAPVARGGMGELYLAEQLTPSGERVRVIIKRLLDNLRDDHAHVAMFRSEAEHLSLLDHKNIVKVLDVPEINGARCLALEYVRGRSVAQILDRARHVGRRIPPEIAVYVVTEVLEGLDHVHRARLADGQPVGLVHRDVTPGNLLVSFDGDVKITDFGISKSLMSKVSTTVGIVKGKARYLAPEQILGEPASPRSDMFSAGCVIYEMLTSIPLFDRPSVPKTLTAIVHGEIPDLPSVLPIPRAQRLVALIGRTLAVATDKRHERARDLAEDLRAAAAQELGPLVGRAAVAAYMRQLFEGQDESWEQIVSPPEELDPSNPVVAFEELVEPPSLKSSSSDRGDRASPLLRAASIADADALEPITADPPPPFAPPPPSADDSMDPAMRSRPPEPTMLVERARARIAATEVVVRAVAPVRDGPGRNESITPVFDGEEATLAVSARSPLDERGQSVTVRGAPPTSGVEPPRILAHGDDVATQAEIVLRPTEPRSSVRVTAPDDSDDNTEAYDETDEAPKVSPREPTRIERPVLVRRPEPTQVSDRLVGTVPAATARAPRPPARARPTESPLPPARKDGAWWSRRPLVALLAVFVLGAGTGVALTAMLRRADEPAVVVAPQSPSEPPREASPIAPLPSDGDAPGATGATNNDAPDPAPTPSAAAPSDPSAPSVAAAEATDDEPPEEPAVEVGAAAPTAEQATLDVTYPRDGRVRLDGKLLAGRIPLKGIVLTPGRHQVTVEWRKKRREVVLEVDAGEHQVVGAKEWRR
jgi:serine/threonine protein kinase